MQSAVRDRAFNPHNDILLLDGYPRDVEQAELLETHIELQLVIHLQVDDDQVLMRRIRERNARPDDRDEEVIRHRFEVYRQRTRPLLSYFDQSRIATVDAADPPLEVLCNVAAALSRFSD
jgi:adenylate kinase